MSHKQYGLAIYQDRLDAIQRKVVAHYAPGNGQTRLGSIGGRSLYNWKLEALAAPTKNFADIICINPSRKEIVASSGANKYQHLIVAHSLPDFLRLARIEHSLKFSASGAKFMIISTRKELRENEVITILIQPPRFTGCSPLQAKLPWPKSPPKHGIMNRVESSKESTICWIRGMNLSWNGKCSCRAAIHSVSAIIKCWRG